MALIMYNQNISLDDIENHQEYEKKLDNPFQYPIEVDILGSFRTRLGDKYEIGPDGNYIRTEFGL